MNTLVKETSDMKTSVMETSVRIIFEFYIVRFYYICDI